MTRIILGHIAGGRIGIMENTTETAMMGVSFRFQSTKSRSSKYPLGSPAGGTVLV